MRFTIVTPAYNMQEWIQDTLETIHSQEGDFEIEHIVVSDGSTDQTAAIARKQKEKIDSGAYPIKCRSITMQVTEQSNAGMYVAINNGFSQGTGEVFAWLNADDLYQPGALEHARRVFEAFPDIQWLKGITATIDDKGIRTHEGNARIYRHDWLKDGVYGMESYFIEQDSVFWTKELWQKAGPIPAHFRSAGDYWLWIAFAKHARLWQMNAPVSCFRKRDGQISKGVVKYKAEQWSARPHRSQEAWCARFFFTLQSRSMPYLQKIFQRVYPLVFRSTASYEYIDFDKSIPVKKRALTYIIG